MIHRILEGPRAGEAAKALFAAGDSFLPPLSMEPSFVNCFRVFSKLEVLTPEQQQQFDTRCQEVGLAYGGVIVRADVGSYLGFAGHQY
jgi:hypothetical protein